MSFENLISNLSDQKVIKAISKPIPKKIISCIREGSYTASEIADKISFPKEKIYYHIKKLVAFKILTVSETNEIKGIIQKKYRLAEISSPLKKESSHNSFLYFSCCQHWWFLNSTWRSTFIFRIPQRS